jgi:Family of unknown function (DUF6153)
MLVVLAGLFGMHGLSSHGAEGAGMGVGPTPEMSMADASMSVATAANVTALAATVVTGSMSSAAVDATGHGAMNMGMSGACMAILAVALIALIRLFLTRGTRRALWLLARPARAPAYSGRDPDPPSLTELSIRRC